MEGVNRMKKFSMQLSSDAIRLSKTPFFIVHLAIPVLGILVFTVYQSMTIYPPEKFTVNYYQVLTLIYLELSIIVQSKHARNFPSPYRIASPHRR